MTDHSPPEDAVEVLANALAGTRKATWKEWAIDALTAAHGAGEIVWRSEYEAVVQRHNTERSDLSGALADSGTLPGDLTPAKAVRWLTKERDEAVALLRGWGASVHDDEPLAHETWAFLARIEGSDR